MTDIDWAAVAAEIHETACEKGWWDEPRLEDMVYALIHSEISEALEAYRKTPDPDEMLRKVGEELVDVVIRHLDWIHFEGRLKPHWIGPDAPSWTTCAPPQPFPTDALGSGWLFRRLHQNVGFGPPEAAIGLVLSWFDDVGLDFATMLRAKMDINKARPHRHGGLRA